MIMIKKLRILLTIMTISALLVGLGLPVVASFDDSPSKVWQLADKGRRGDDPWDPGDESEDVPTIAGVVTSGQMFIKQVWLKNMDRSDSIARRADDPWDPGEESGRITGVRHA